MNESCTDTDEGKEYYEKGEVTGYSNWPPEMWTHEDCCIDSYENGTCVSESEILVERYCGNNFWNTFVYHECPNGCENGACIGEVECTTNEDCPSEEGEHYCKNSNSRGLCVHRATQMTYSR